MDTQTSTDLVIAGLAAPQHGVVSRMQLLAAGLSREQIAGRVRRGLLRRLWPGVYVAGIAPPSDAGRWLGAVLSRRGDAWLSHLTAARLWGMWSSTSPLVDLTVPAERSHTGHRLIAIHRSRRLDSPDFTVRDAIPVTTPARTVIDLAATLDRPALERIIGEGRRTRILTDRSLDAITVRRRRHPGIPEVAEILDRGTHGYDVTESQLEVLFLALCERHGIPIPVINRPLGRRRPDFRWPAERVIVETDGKRDHLTDAAFESDRERDVDATVAGWRTLRFTWRQLTEREQWVAASLRAALSRGAG